MVLWCDTESRFLTLLQSEETCHSQQWHHLVIWWRAVWAAEKQKHDPGQKQVMTSAFPILHFNLLSSASDLPLLWLKCPFCLKLSLNHLISRAASIGTRVIVMALMQLYSSEVITHIICMCFTDICPWTWMQKTWQAGFCAIGGKWVPAWLMWIPWTWIALWVEMIINVKNM